jgi:hypothetical protein
MRNSGECEKAALVCEMGGGTFNIQPFHDFSLNCKCSYGVKYLHKIQRMNLEILCKWTTDQIG